MTIRYVKIRVKTSGGIVLTRFAKQLTNNTFLILDKFGTHNHHYFVGSKKDIIWIKPARMNKHYGELEIEKEKT